MASRALPHTLPNEEDREEEKRKLTLCDCTDERARAETTCHELVQKSKHARPEPARPFACRGWLAPAAPAGSNGQRVHMGNF